MAVRCRTRVLVTAGPHAGLVVNTDLRRFEVPIREPIGHHFDEGWSPPALRCASYEVRPWRVSGDDREYWFAIPAGMFMEDDRRASGRLVMEFLWSSVTRGATEVTI